MHMAEKMRKVLLVCFSMEKTSLAYIVTVWPSVFLLPYMFQMRDLPFATYLWIKITGGGFAPAVCGFRKISNLTKKNIFLPYCLKTIFPDTLRQIQKI